MSQRCVGVRIQRRPIGRVGDAVRERRPGQPRHVGRVEQHQSVGPGFGQQPADLLLLGFDFGPSG